MAKNSKLQNIAEEQGESLESLIPRLIQEEGSIFKAAVRLEVGPNTLQYWLKKNGYSVKTRQTAQVVKQEEEVPA